MPSTLLTAASGIPFPLISGNAFSGQGVPHPVGGVQLVLSPSASGNAYISLSGLTLSGDLGTTVNSGGFFLSGGGLNDGILLAPGGGYFIPRLGIGPSGQLNLFASCDPAASGQARLYWECF